MKVSGVNSTKLSGITLKKSRPLYAQTEVFFFKIPLPPPSVFCSDIHSSLFVLLNALAGSYIFNY